MSFLSSITLKGLYSDCVGVSSLVPAAKQPKRPYGVSTAETSGNPPRYTYNPNAVAAQAAASAAIAHRQPPPALHKTANPTICGNPKPCAMTQPAAIAGAVQGSDLGSGSDK